MARVEVDFSRLGTDLRPQLTATARYALQIYRRAPLRLDRPDYPFAQHEGDGSIRDTRSSTITPLPNGIRIAVQSRGATFLERGNDGHGRFINAGPNGELRLPLRSSKRPRRNGKRGKVYITDDGNVYLAVQRVRTFRGRHLLERSVSQAFTGRSGLRGGPL